MKKTVTAHVGADRVPTLNLPLGEGSAHTTVSVTVETAEPTGSSAAPARTPEPWQQFIDATAGKWLGTLERPPQGEYEKRADWP